MENLILSVSLTNDNNQTQDALMYVTKLQQTQSRWCHTFVTLQKQKNNLAGQLLTNGTLGEMYSEVNGVIEKLKGLLGCKSAILTTAPIAQVNYQFDKSKVKINSIVRGYYKSSAGKNVAMYQQTEKDSAGELITDYLARVGSVAPDLWVEQQVTTTVVRKMAFKKKTIDWSKTWNSPYLTDEEKQYLRQTLDLDIWFSNSKRESYQLFSHMIETYYENRDYTAIGLHGNFGSGKSEMVKCYAAEHDAPMMYIACSSLIKIQNLFAKVGPSLINGKAELTVQESIWAKCEIYNLPLIVNLDEMNLLTVEESNALAPIITEHKGVVNATNKAFLNDNTIIYVGAWNPDTANAKSLDGKMYDRLLFINVEDVSKDVMKKYKISKQLASLFGISNLSYYQDQISKLPKDIQDKINRSLAKNPATSDMAIDAYLKAVTAAPQPIVPVRNKLVLHHVEDVTLDTPKEVADARNRMEDLIEKVNGALYQNTKGIDTKNFNRNFAFNFPERSTDYVCDLIMQYSSVEKALQRAISDILPGGNTLRVGTDKQNNSRIDNTPYRIAEEICTALSTDIELLDTWLFDAAAGGATSEMINTLNGTNPVIGWLENINITSEQADAITNEQDIDDFINELQNS